MKFLIAAVFLGLFATLALCQENYPEEWAIYDRPCQVRKDELVDEVRTPFSFLPWSGTWFERESYRWHENSKVDCLTSHYTWFFTRRSFEIERDGIVLHENDDDEGSANATLVYRRATGLVAFPDANPVPGMLNVTYDDRQEGDDVNYYILGTDYYSYAITWGCENLPNDQSREYAWILTRIPELDPELPEDAQTLSRIESYIDTHLDRDFLEFTNQTEALCNNLRR